MALKSDASENSADKAQKPVHLLHDLHGFGSVFDSLLTSLHRFLGNTFRVPLAKSKAKEMEILAKGVAAAGRRVSRVSLKQDGLELQAYAQPPLKKSLNESLLARAEQRDKLEKLTAQKNIEMISFLALNQAKEFKDAPNKKIDEEWLHRFLDASSYVSNDEMQTLWAKILASEAKMPGSYSKRVIGCLSLLEKQDALNFEKLCRYSCLYPWGEKQPMVFDHADKFYTEKGIDLQMLLHLSSIGLINLARLQTFEHDVPPEFIVRHGKEEMHLKLIVKKGQKKKPFLIGKVTFTQIGAELSQVCSQEAIPGFVRYLSLKWGNSGFKVKPK